MNALPRRSGPRPTEGRGAHAHALKRFRPDIDRDGFPAIDTLKHPHRISAKTVELSPESHNTEHAPRRIDLTKETLSLDGYVVGALMGGMFECANAQDPAA